MVRKVFCLSPKAGTEINVYFITTKKEKEKEKQLYMSERVSMFAGLKVAGDE